MPVLHQGFKLSQSSLQGVGTLLRVRTDWVPQCPLKLPGSWGWGWDTAARRSVSSPGT